MIYNKDMTHHSLEGSLLMDKKQVSKPKHHRISTEEALVLLTQAPLPILQQRAHEARLLRHPNPHVSFVVDTNPNYTNICTMHCSFCAFCRNQTAPDAYFKTAQELIPHFEFAKKVHATTVLLQGGVCEKITVDYLVEILELIKKNYPTLHPHFYSAVEIWNAAKNSGMSVRNALERLYQAGQRTLPGGGAEILVEHIRKTLSPQKMYYRGWIELHMLAHSIGFVSTATMMYGHIETAEDILEHLNCLRIAQDKTGGFSSFIPWSYKSTHTPLRRHVKKCASKELYLRIIAVSRLFLDNFSHIGATWFSEGKETGIEALRYGADDFGGTIYEESVHKSADHISTTTVSEICEMIQKAGFQPIQRDSFYRTLGTVI